ncbi:toll-like receptor 5 [Engraulis encrasicolus]|uniref:toll-like receptor 5 n=1 Tax=Engraulis encrasicolus TaxID=184585 RepID=UPI002FD200F2
MITSGPIFTLLLGASICLFMAQHSHQCLIYQHWAICRGRSLTQVPQLPSSVTHLDLSMNHLRHLSEDSFEGMESLVYLDLGSQLLGQLFIQNNTFRGLQNLTHLHLGDNRKIHFEEDAFQGLTNLHTLILLHCDLDKSILSGRYLKPLVSLQELDLYGNQIKSFEPAMFFRNMTDLRVLDLSLNRVKSICERDFAALQGRHFRQFRLSSVPLTEMNPSYFNWKECGNPFRNMSFDTLDLSLTGLSTSKAILFLSGIQGTRINHLVIGPNIIGSGFGTSNFQDPDRHTFEPLKFSGVKSIDLSKNFISVVKHGIFTPLSALENITMAGNKINRIDVNAFQGLSDLQRLNLSHNLIGEIYASTFRSLPNLRTLDLSHNHIGVLQYGAFSGLNLLLLDLTGNSLSSVHSISPLPSLQELYLDDNKIATVYGLQKAAKSVTTISLNNNRLRNVEDLYTILAHFPNATRISVADNSISFCSGGPAGRPTIPSSYRVKELFLQNNNLDSVWEKGQCLDLFDQLGELSSLSLSSNRLETLHEGVFKGLSSLHSLDLSKNCLTHLPQGILPTSLRTLDLSHNFLGSPDPDVLRFLNAVDMRKNRFVCDCDLGPFGQWVKQSNTTLLTPVSQLHCEFPKNLRGVAITNFTTESCDR